MRRTVESDADTDPPKHQPVVTRGAGGKTYLCHYWALPRVDRADSVVDGREKILKARKASYHAFVKAHPEHLLAPEDYDRYTYLRDRTRQQIRAANRSIRAYNAVLRDACEPD